LGRWYGEDSAGSGDGSVGHSCDCGSKLGILKSEKLEEGRGVFIKYLSNCYSVKKAFALSSG
jgi:hypothetical protein